MGGKWWGCHAAVRFDGWTRTSRWFGWTLSIEVSPVTTAEPFTVPLPIKLFISGRTPDPTKILRRPGRTRAGTYGPGTARVMLKLLILILPLRHAFRHPPLLPASYPIPNTSNYFQMQSWFRVFARGMLVYTLFPFL